MEAMNTLHYLKYAQNNAKSWQDFASEKQGLELEDLIFVTGVDYASMWATAVHDGTSILALDFGPKTPYPDDAARDKVESFWKEYLQSVLNGSSGVSEQRVEDELPFPEGRDGRNKADCNQALFLRHVRAKRRARPDAKGEAGRSASGTSSEYLLEKGKHAAAAQNVSSGRERVSLIIASSATRTHEYITVH